ncbi:MAG: hypothetical protein V4664_00435 [Patescibacteria group bacterium]
MNPAESIHPNDQFLTSTGSRTLSFADYKKSLGSVADKYSDEKLKEIYTLTERLASTLFDKWIKDTNKVIKNQ